MALNPFVGAWRLISWENRATDGRVTYPMGKEATGYILYTPDGHVSVAIMADGRPRYTGNDALGGSVEERARAARTYLSYAGTYEIGNSEIIHHVQVSLFPNWVGDVQSRYFAFDGDHLTLSTAPMLLGGIERRAYLVWERTDPSSVSHS